MTLNEKDIAKAYSRLEARRCLYRENRAYVCGKNPEILGDYAKKDPDNRIPVPLAKSAVDDMAGFAGRPGDIQTVYHLKDGDTPPDDEYVNLIKKWSADNDDDLEVSALYREGLTQGVGYEVWWAEASKEPGTPVVPEWKMVPGDQIEIVRTDSLKPVTMSAVRFMSDGKNMRAVAYYPFMAEGWKQVNDTWKRDTDLDLSYPYSVVPVVEFRTGPDEVAFFEAEKKLIDALDSLISKSVNEIERFNALVALFPGKVTKEFVDKLKEKKVVDDLAQYDHWPEFLEKNLGGVQGFYTDLADRIERLFHKTIKVPDFSDENFASNASGIAMAYKMIGMEFRAATIEAYFKRGLYQRQPLFNDIFRVSTLSVDPSLYTLTVTCRRNLPVDDAGKLTSALQMKALGMSNETVLKYLPASIVPDYERELERLESAKEDMADLGDIDDLGNSTATDMASATGNIQQTALNGAQVDALSALAANVTDGIMPVETAKAIAMAAFPAISQDVLNSIFGPLSGFKKQVEPVGIVTE